MSANVITTNQYIASDPAILHGVPIINGSRTPVRAIAEYYMMGMSVEAMKSALSHLTESEIFAALSYYFDHREEIDEDIRLNNDHDYWKSVTTIHPKAND